MVKHKSSGQTLRLQIISHLLFLRIWHASETLTPRTQPIIAISIAAYLNQSVKMMGQSLNSSHTCNLASSLPCGQVQRVHRCHTFSTNGEQLLHGLSGYPLCRFKGVVFLHAWICMDAGRSQRRTLVISASLKVCTNKLHDAGLA